MRGNRRRDLNMTSIYDVDQAIELFVRVAHDCSVTSNADMLSDVTNSRSGSMALRQHCDLELSTVERLRSRLRDGERELDRVRAAVRKRWNSCADINKLPVEILQSVFDLCNAASIHLEDDRIPHPALILSAVCAHWREIAFHSPLLWSRISITGSRTQSHLEYLRQRAQGIPLTVVFKPCYDDTAYFSKSETGHLLQNLALDFISANLPHVADLTVELSNRGFDTLLRGAAAPSLVACNIMFTNPDAEDLLRFDGPLFNDSAPKLSRLRLEGLYFPWTPQCLKNLTVITMQDCHLAFSPADGVRPVLEALPSLEVLEIAGWCPEFLDTVDTPKDLPRIEMKQLHTIKLHMPGSFIYHVLSSIAAPSVRIFYIDADSVTSARCASAFVSRHALPPLFFSALSRLTVEAEYVHGLTYCIDSTVEGFSEGGDRNLVLHWQVTEHEAPMSPGSQLASHFNILRPSLQSLDAIYVDCSERLCADLSLGALVRLPTLRNFTFQKNAAITLLAELAESYTAETTGEIQQVSLRSCVLDHASFNALSSWCHRRGLGTLSLYRTKISVPSVEDMENCLKTLLHIGKETRWLASRNFQFEVAAHSFRSPFGVDPDAGDCDEGKEYFIRNGDGYSRRVVIAS